MKKNRTDLDKVTDGIYLANHEELCHFSFNQKELLESIDSSLTVIIELLKYRKHELLEQYSRLIAEEDRID